MQSSGSCDILDPTGKKYFKVGMLGLTFISAKKHFSLSRHANQKIISDCDVIIPLVTLILGR